MTGVVRVLVVIILEVLDRGHYTLTVDTNTRGVNFEERGMSLLLGSFIDDRVDTFFIRLVLCVLSKLYTTKNPRFCLTGVKVVIMNKIYFMFCR